MVARGKLSEEDARARLRMLPPKSGYIAFLLAVCLICMWCWKNRFFSGIETIVGVLMLVFSIGLLAFAFRQMRKARR